MKIPYEWTILLGELVDAGDKLVDAGDGVILKPRDIAKLKEILAHLVEEHNRAVIAERKERSEA